jgi:hypothetical protein
MFEAFTERLPEIGTAVRLVLVPHIERENKDHQTKDAEEKDAEEKDSEEKDSEEKDSEEKESAVDPN